MQQQPRVFDAERRQHVHVGDLSLGGSVLHVEDAGYLAGAVVHLELHRPGLSADLGASQHRLRSVGDMHRTLGTALATPLAVPVVHAWRAALVSTRQDGQRILGPANPSWSMPRPISRSRAV